MIITKTFEVALNIQNYISIYTNLESNLLEIVTDKYEGKCFRRCLILQIKRIIRYGNCTINQNGPPTFGIIPVIFEADALYFAEGEVITDCRVLNKNSTNNTILCASKSSRATIYFKQTPLFASVTVGQIVPVTVFLAKYKILTESISINSAPIVPRGTFDFYEIEDTRVDNNALQNVLARIGAEEQLKVAREKDKGYQFFEQLLIPVNKTSEPKSCKVINIKDFAKRPFLCFICKDTRTGFADEKVCCFTKNPSENPAITGLSTTAVIIALLENYCSNMRVVREMSEIYKTEEMLMAHKNLWQIYKKQKIA